jgi:hypothetical protein
MRQMRNRRKKPSRAAVEARATVISDDIFAGRSVRQASSNTQKIPEGDGRYRTTYSAKFYVVQLMGVWVNVSESAERTVHYRNRAKWVRFENKHYELKREENFKSFVGHFIQGGCYAYVGGKEVYTVKELNNIEEWPFIYISSSESLRIFNEMRRKA